MHSVVVNCDKLEIRQFKSHVWKKEEDIEKLPRELIALCNIPESIERNGGWYYCEMGEYTLFAFLANLGIHPHPLIELSYASAWYNSNIGGVYLIGKDKNTGAFFAPVSN